MALLRKGAASWLILALLLAGGPALSAQTATPREYQIKAVFLLNFAQFVEWPAGAWAHPAAPFVIGVLGEDPFGRFLDETVQGERANHRPIVVRRYRRVEEIADCHILYISRSESARLGEIIARLTGRSILTVGDVERFALNGGMIRFLTENNRTRFRINVEAARAAHLAISSKLLRPAEIIGTGKD